MDAYTQKLKEYISALDSIIEKASDLKRGDSVSWNSSGGTARGKITKVITSGSEQIPNSSFKITGTAEDPGALVRVYTKQSDKYVPTDTIVGHKLKTLTKIADLG
jgi:hypothetical protein